MLQNLPPEILVQITSLAPTASFVSNLSLTSRSLHAFVESEGWKSFVLSRFPSLPVPPLWKDASHALTTLSRNWDRKAFLIRPLWPTSHIHYLPSHEVLTQWKIFQQQTMGYQPVIDSYEEWTGGSWDSRTEVVAWGAGSELLLKTVKRGDSVLREYHATPSKERTQQFESTRNRFEWLIYGDKRYREGRDDITTVKILRGQQIPIDLDKKHGEALIVGRASGGLHLLRLSKGSQQCEIAEYDTFGASIQSADINNARSPLLAACLGDSKLALYPVHSESTYIPSINAIETATQAEPKCRLWSTKFLSNSKLAVGRGVSKDIVQVYDVAPDGLSPTPVRTFRKGDDSRTSVYPLARIPESSVASDATGNTFLSGGYDGNIRLHDLRSPEDYEQITSDPTEHSAIFSMSLMGRERLITGGAQNSQLKVFDLRMAGGRIYSYLDVPANAASKARRDASLDEPDSFFAGGYNLSPTQSGKIPRNSNTSRLRVRDSSMYSLSIPSPSSPSLYIGTEGQVYHATVTGIFDPHPDPRFAAQLVFDLPKQKRHINFWRTWDPDGTARNLMMYGHKRQGNLNIYRQEYMALMAPSHVQRAPEGLDARWTPAR